MTLVLTSCRGDNNRKTSWNNKETNINVFYTNNFNFFAIFMFVFSKLIIIVFTNNIMITDLSSWLDKSHSIVN